MSAKFISFKPNVRISRLNNDTQAVFNALLDTAPKLYNDTIVVTSIHDSAHSAESAHYSNLGWDVRTHGKRAGGISGNKVDTFALIWVTALRRMLGDRYFILYEQAKKHIHIQVRKPKE